MAVAEPEPDVVTVRPIRVLIVDDSAVMRAIFNRTIGVCPGIEIVGQASNAREAIDCLRAMRTDVILLDLEMPGMNGLAALPLLIGAGGGARVMVVSSNSMGEAGLRARELGAVETLQKPAGLDYAGDFTARLLDGVRRLGHRDRAGAKPAAVPPPARLPSRTLHPAGLSAASGQVKGDATRLGVLPAIVGIAASTGGVLALRQLLGALPPSFALPILVTQHLPAAFLPFFATQLEEATSRPTRVAETGLPLIAGHILVAPGHAHLTVARTSSFLHVRLDETPAPSGCRPSADPMFASLARLYGAGAMGVILSGMGRDGADGAQALAGVGGTIFAQDQASSVVWGMPGVAVRRGLARAVLPPVELAGALVEATAPESARWN